MPMTTPALSPRAEASASTAAESDRTQATRGSAVIGYSPVAPQRGAIML
jgi:hypothetical protein